MMQFPAGRRPIADEPFGQERHAAQPVRIILELQRNTQSPGHSRLASVCVSDCDAMGVDSGVGDFESERGVGHLAAECAEHNINTRRHVISLEPLRC